MLVDNIREVISDNAEFFGLAILLIGVLIGHWLTLGRDIRKEFNEAAQPIRAWLLREIERPSANSQRPSVDELDAFIRRLPLLEGLCFRRAYKRQQEARQKAMAQDRAGGVYYREDAIPLIKKRLRKCLRYTVMK